MNDVEVEVESIVHETDNAILVRLVDDRGVWLPLDYVRRITRRRDGSATLLIADWLARKEDL